MNEQQQRHWANSSVTQLTQKRRQPAVRHLSLPHSARPMCDAQGEWEAQVTPAAAFAPATWNGCQLCALVLSWLLEDSARTPSLLLHLRQMLGDQAFGSEMLIHLLLLHQGSIPLDELSSLEGHAPLSVWREDLQVNARGERGVLIEAGVRGCFFPFQEIVVLVRTEELTDGYLHTSCLEARAAVHVVSAVGAERCCIITLNHGPYWDRALYHNLQPR